MPFKPPLNLLATLFLLALMAGGTAGCKRNASESITREPIAFAAEGELRILRPGEETALVDLEIEIADSSYEIQTGMMYRKEMDEREAMLFIFPEEAPRSFYMKNTLIALDILFMDKDLKIIRIHRNAVPLDETGIPSGGPAQYVLEVRAGMADRWGIQEGDLVQYQKRP